jgi:hypothetical protein
MRRIVYSLLWIDLCVRPRLHNLHGPLSPIAPSGRRNNDGGLYLKSRRQHDVVKGYGIEIAMDAR